MKYIITIGLLLIFLITKAQKVGEIILKTGEKIDLHHKTLKKGKFKLVKFHGSTIYYFNKDGKPKSANQSKVETMTINGTSANGHYISLPIFIGKAKRLHRIVAENDKYLLTDYYSIGRFQFYIFNKSTMEVVEKLKFQTYKPKKDIKLIDIVKKYFADCPEFVENVQSNFDTFYGKKNYRKQMYHQEPKSVLFDGISEFKCN